MRFEIVFQTGGDWSNSFEHSKRQLVERVFHVSSIFVRA